MTTSQENQTETKTKLMTHLVIFAEIDFKSSKLNILFHAKSVSEQMTNESTRAFCLHLRHEHEDKKQ